MQRSGARAAPAWVWAAAVLLAAVGAAAAVPAQPRELTCLPSIIESVTSCTAIGTVLAGGCAWARGMGRQAPVAAAAAPTGRPSKANRRRSLPIPAADGNITYAFTAEEGATGQYDIVLTLRTHAGDADL